jgi:hypothetical protein
MADAATVVIIGIVVIATFMAAAADGTASRTIIAEPSSGSPLWHLIDWEISASEIGTWRT